MSVALVVFVLLTVALFALFLGGGLVAQGYWYQEVAELLPLRAAGAAVLVGGYCTLWAVIDRAQPGKYSTFFEFAPYDRQEFDEFEAVRWTSSQPPQLHTDAAGQPVETVHRFRKGAGGRTDSFAEISSGIPFQLSGTLPNGHAYMTAALRIPLEEGSEPVRFDAVLRDDGRGGKVYAGGPEGRRFVEAGGERYVFADQIGVVYVPTPGAVAIALTLNLMLFVVWLIALWPVMQFASNHAAGLALLFGFVTILIIMPLLFQWLRPAAGAAVAAAATATAPAGVAPGVVPAVLIAAVPLAATG